MCSELTENVTRADSLRACACMHHVDLLLVHAKPLRGLAQVTLRRRETQNKAALACCYLPLPLPTNDSVLE